MPPTRDVGTIALPPERTYMATKIEVDTAAFEQASRDVGIS